MRSHAILTLCAAVAVLAACDKLTPADAGGEPATAGEANKTGPKTEKKTGPKRDRTADTTKVAKGTSPAPAEAVGVGSKHARKPLSPAPADAAEGSGRGEEGASAEAHGVGRRVGRSHPGGPEGRTAPAEPRRSGVHPEAEVGLHAAEAVGEGAPPAVPGPADRDAAPMPTATAAATDANGFVTYAPSDVPAADVVVALGVRPKSTFLPSTEMVANLATAVSIWEYRKAPRLMVCGGYTRGHIAEAEMMKLLAQAMGVPPDAILMDNGSHDTKENARDAAMIASRDHLGSAILVAQPKHVQRATSEFVAAAGFAAVYPVIASEAEPAFRSCGVDGVPARKTYDALVVHGTSPGFDFGADPLSVSPALTATIAVASGFLRQNLAPKVLLFHDMAAWGHVKRTEVMTILATAMGIPESSILCASSRRYEMERQSLAKLCSAGKVRTVLAVLPETLRPDSDAIRQQYAEANVKADFVFVCDPGWN